MNMKTRMLIAALATTMAAACGAGSENAPDTTMPPGEAQPPGMSNDGNAQAQAQPQAQPQQLQPSQMCPADLPGVSVTAQDTQDGSALVFTSNTGNVEALRGRVQNLATLMNNQKANQKPESGTNMHEMGPHHTYDHGSGMPQQAPGQVQGANQGVSGELVAARARVENIEKGARLVLTPVNPAQLAMVRGFVQEQAGKLSSGDCSVVTRMYQGTTQYQEQNQSPGTEQPNPSQSQPPERMPDQPAPPDLNPPPSQQVPGQDQPPPAQMPDQSQGQPSPSPAPDSNGAGGDY